MLARTFQNRSPGPRQWPRTGFFSKVDAGPPATKISRYLFGAVDADTGWTSGGLFAISNSTLVVSMDNTAHQSLSVRGIHSHLHRQPLQFYGSVKTVTGSTRVARRAGNEHAASAMIPSRMITPAITRGSIAPRP
jgi:hypothetical protein